MVNLQTASRVLAVLLFRELLVIVALKEILTCSETCSFLLVRISHCNLQSYSVQLQKLRTIFFD